MQACDSKLLAAIPSSPWSKSNKAFGSAARLWHKMTDEFMLMQDDRTLPTMGGEDPPFASLLSYPVAIAQTPNGTSNVVYMEG